MDDMDLKTNAHAALLDQKFSQKPKRSPNFKKSDKEYWHDTMMSLIQAFQLKNPAQLTTCGMIADSYIKMLNERFK